MAAPSKRRRDWYFLAQNGRCYLCGKEMKLGTHGLFRKVEPNEATWDHIQPRVSLPCGKRNDRSNLMLAHASCNAAKGSSKPLLEHVFKGRDLHGCYMHQHWPDVTPKYVQARYVRAGMNEGSANG